MTLLVGNSASIYGASGVIAESAKSYTELFMISDGTNSASVDIVTGTPAASTIMRLRAPAGGQGPAIPFLSTTCLIASNMENGSLIATVKR